MIQAVKYPTLVGFYCGFFFSLTTAKSLRWFTELPRDLIHPPVGESCFSLITVDLIMISVCFRASGGGCHGQDIIIWRSWCFLSLGGYPGEILFFFVCYFLLRVQMPSTRQAVTQLPSTSLFPPKKLSAQCRQIQNGSLESWKFSPPHIFLDYPRQPSKERRVHRQGGLGRMLESRLRHRRQRNQSDIPLSALVSVSHPLYVALIRTLQTVKGWPDARAFSGAVLTRFKHWNPPKKHRLTLAATPPNIEHQTSVIWLRVHGIKWGYWHCTFVG